jgi:digeranylgeranylglycerophospholipid reductase
VATDERTWQRFDRRRRLGRLVAWLAAFGVFAVSWRFLDTEVVAAETVPREINDLLTRMYPPDFAYTGDIVALNADVEANYEKVSRPDVVFEGYVGYFWVFPKSERRANVGIGWASENRPDNYIEELWGACDRFDVPRPPREDVGVYTIPRGPSLDPDYARFDENVFLVGDAAGIANRYQGEGIAQAIRSSYLLADLVREGRAAEYPDRLYESMRAEYRLATLMRAVWETTEDPTLLAGVADAIDGLSVVDVSRHPRRVMARIARRPRLLARLLAVPAIRSRLVDAYTDTWEFDADPKTATHTVPDRRVVGSERG